MAMFCRADELTGRCTTEDNTSAVSRATVETLARYAAACSVKKPKTEMNTKIDYDAIKTQKNEMLQCFLLAKKRAELSGQLVAKPI